MWEGVDIGCATTDFGSQIRPLEELYKFHEFYSPLLEDADLEAKPMVLLLGQYSTGKTSFISCAAQLTRIGSSSALR